VPEIWPELLYVTFDKQVKMLTYELKNEQTVSVTILVIQNPQDNLNAGLLAWFSDLYFLL
jgi:hypothetical protein